METTEVRAIPEVNDVVTGIDGLRGIVRAVHPSGHTKVATHGDHDEGVWVLTEHLTVVYREGATQLDERRRPAAAAARRRCSEVRSLVVDRDVWKTALRLAGGDGKRITIVSATEVRVH